jgi:hypothetical protein
MRRRVEPVSQVVLEPPRSTVLDVLDELLKSGVMADGDVMLGLAGVDLIYLRLSALLCGAARVLPHDPVPPRGRRPRRRVRRTKTRS